MWKVWGWRSAWVLALVSVLALDWALVPNLVLAWALAWALVSASVLELVSV